MIRLITVFLATLAAFGPSPFTLTAALAQDAALGTREVRDLGFEEGGIGQCPDRWFVPTPGWAAELTDATAADGRVSLTLVQREASDAPFGNVMCMIDAAPYRGRRVKLSAQIRAQGPEGAMAMMWLRADLNDGTTGAFYNMHDRPVLPAPEGDATWSDAVIELDIEPHAKQLAFGFMSNGGATLFIDAARLDAGAPTEVAPPQEPDEPRPLSPRGMENLQAATRLLSYVRFFHASDQAVAVMSWDHLAVGLMEAAEPAPDAADLAERLRAFFAPIAPTLEIWAGGPEDAPPLPEPQSGIERVVSWRHHGAGNLSGGIEGNVYSSAVERDRLPATLPRGARTLDPEAHAAAFIVKPLGAGVACRLPVRVYSDGESTLPRLPVETAWSTSDDKPLLTAESRATRLAGVALCWGVMQHFYPYFDVVETDWEAALADALAAAAEDADRHAYLHTLQELIAKLHDGHGNVWNPDLLPPTMLPLRFGWAGDDLVVTGKDGSAPAEIARGDVVLAIEGKDVSSWCGEFSPRISAATEGWRRVLLLRSFVLEVPGAEETRLRLRRGDGTEFDTTVARIPLDRKADFGAEKPADGAEIAPGIVYFDLNGAETESLNAAMPALQEAAGIVFDLRGYPNSAAMEVLRQLSRERLRSARWNIPVVTLPDGEGWEWDGSGRWDLQPLEPRLGAEIAFLTDGRAISYAESIMGIVEAYNLGEIVGATTAGTNGNVNPFSIPGGYTVLWTGMKVLKHDGSQHHGVGIAPTVPVEPTAEGIAEGRDEVLERAVEVLQAKIAAGDE